MEVEAGMKLKTASDIEVAFLEALEKRPLPVEEMLEMLASVDGEGGDQLAEMLQETLIEQEECGGLLRVLAQRSAWHAEDIDFGRSIRSAARKVFTDRNSHALIDSAGLGEIGCSEAVRRMCVLLSLKAGVLVHDHTWGYGEVKRLDDFYRKVTIDFSRKRGHQLAFGYAGETLTVLTDGHVLARVYREPEAIQAMVKSAPGELVKLTLRSFGPLSLNRLEDILTQDVLGKKPWKSFWESARKVLKSDPLIEMPARRTELIHLRKSRKCYDDEWARSVGEVRDPAEILSLMNELEESGKDEITQEGLALLAERCAFAILGTTRNPALMSRLAMQARRLELDSDAVGLEDARRELENHGALMQAAQTLPVKEIRSLIEFLLDGTEEVALGLIRLIPQMTSSLLNEAITQLFESDWSEQARQRVNILYSGRTASPPLVVWGCRNVEIAVDGGLVAMSDLMAQAISVLETTEGADTLKMRNQVTRLFERLAWVKDCLSRMSQDDMRGIIERLQRMQGWDSSSKRSLIGRIIKLNPDLTKQVADNAEEEDPEPFAGRFTSWRSLRERKDALKKIIEVDIPANSRDIAHGRSYGDLRENFEYQSAKDAQRLLMRRKAEYENDLSQVKGTDFKGVPTDSAGMGTAVLLEKEGGETLSYVILGEWDRDEELSIVSSRSALAEALMGKGAGDSVELPGEATTEAKIVEVSPLGEDVRKWIGVG